MIIALVRWKGGQDYSRRYLFKLFNAGDETRSGCWTSLSHFGALSLLAGAHRGNSACTTMFIKLTRIV
jgi:hypothetical protein